jgi:hypothetical protein
MVASERRRSRFFEVADCNAHSLGVLVNSFEDLRDSEVVLASSVAYFLQGNGVEMGAFELVWVRGLPVSGFQAIL